MNITISIALAFRQHQNAAVLEFRRQPTRAAAHVGGVYKTDPTELKKQLEDILLRPGGRVCPFHAIRRNDRAPSSRRTSIFIGAARRTRGRTRRCGKRWRRSLHPARHVALQRSDAVYSDLQRFRNAARDGRDRQGVCQQLQAKCAEDFFVDEYLHRGEHSLEFQVLFLKYIAQQRAAMRGEPERAVQDRADFGFLVSFRSARADAAGENPDGGKVLGWTARAGA